MLTSTCPCSVPRLPGRGQQSLWKLFLYSIPPQEPGRAPRAGIKSVFLLLAVTSELSELPQAQPRLLSAVLLYNQGGLGGSAAVWGAQTLVLVGSQNYPAGPASFWGVCARMGCALFSGGDGLPGQESRSQGMCLEGFVPKDLSHPWIQLWIPQSQRCLGIFLSPSSVRALG